MYSKRSLSAGSIVFACSLIMAFEAVSADNSVEFLRDVRPILAEKCFTCHGPDGATREEEIRFDTKEGLFGKTESGFRLIVQGDAEESEIFYRITEEDPDERMPPEDFQFQLTEQEIDTIERWIEEGAPWEGHWAFIPPKKVPLPIVSDPAWPKNEIDYYVLSGLDGVGLNPSAEARKGTLIRRVSLDLTGLPPSTLEVDAFLADDSPAAYEKVVDRLLASPHYGERMAFPWLDEARYSDTNGYQRDTKRTMWPWRDWVIDAFNDNMPFDQFTIEQLAGDLLPEATLSQKIATGFNRNHRINGEGGIIPEEYAVEYVVDRVSTTSTAWMGLTMACARCHDHKYDPITQKEFYEMFAFFNRVPEEGKGGEVGNDVPLIQVPTEGDLTFKSDLSQKIAALKTYLYRPDEALDRLQHESEVALGEIFETLDWEVFEPATTSAANGTILEVLDDHSVLASGDTPDEERYQFSFKAAGPIRSFKLDLLMDESLSESGPGRSDTGNVVLSEFIVQRNAAGTDETETLQLVDAISDVARIGSDYAFHNAIDSDSETGWSIGTHLERENRKAVFILDEASAIQAGDEVIITLKHESTLKKNNAGRFKISGTSSNELASWVRPTLGTWHHLGPFAKKKHSDKILDQMTEPEKGYDSQRTYGKEKLRWEDKPEWTKESIIVLEDGGSDTITYAHCTIDASISAFVSLSFGSYDAVKLWIDGKPHLSKGIARLNLLEPDNLPIYLSEGRHEILIKLINDIDQSRFTFQIQNDGGESLLALIDRLARPKSERTEDDRLELQRLFRMQDSEWQEKSGEFAALEAELSEYDRRITTTMVMEDMDTPRDTYVLRRGVYDQPDTSELLTPSVPALFGEMTESLPKNRLGLAQWLVSPDHPLTARVRVNQYWQMYFGRGIVKTSEDFGTQSAAPTHPELLDYLAVDFIESGWDVKAMQKKIVMSATYRQSSALTKAYLRKDPENLLLGHSPRFRLSAATIRDQALSVSGLLKPEIGGPSVFPYQPENMWSALTFQNKDEASTNYYTPDTGDNLYRRGLYTFWKRTIAPPRMQIFDASDRERCSMRQDVTNTPLQAMALLNDPTFIEASRHLAERMMREGGKSSEDRIRYGYKLALAHEPDLERYEILEQGFKSYKKHFKKRKEDAKDFISVGDSEYDDDLKRAELAAYTMLASVILNLDETITRE